MALIKTNARSSSALDATILTGNLPAISGASLTGVSSEEILVASGNATSGSSAQIIVDNCFTSTYTAYRIIIYDLMTDGGTGNVATALQFRTGGASGSNYSGSEYHARCFRGYSGHTNYETDNTTGGTELKLAYTAVQYGESDSNNAAAFEMKLFNTNGFQSKFFWHWSSQHSGSDNSYIFSAGGGGVSQTTAITGFNFFNNDSRAFTEYRYRILGLQ